MLYNTLLSLDLSVDPVRRVPQSYVAQRQAEEHAKHVKALHAVRLLHFGGTVPEQLNSLLLALPWCSLATSSTCSLLS